MTQLHEREMVLPAPQANVIRAMAKNGGNAGGANGPVTIINQTTGRIDKVTETTQPNGDRALIIQEVKRAVIADLYQPNSKMSKAMKDSFGVQRQRS